MKTKFTSKTQVLIVSIVLICLSAAPASAQGVTNYKDYVKTHDDTGLVSLTSQNHPAICLKGNSELKKYGEGAAQVLYTDVASLPMLTKANEAFGKVELIKINFNSPADEAVKLDLAQLTAFGSLKYVIFVYQYFPCGDKKDTCLQTKTESSVSIPAASSVNVLYMLSVPE